MSRVFEQFHLSLIERDEPTLFEPSRNREDWLRAKFANGFNFRHHGKDFYWVPRPYSDEFIVGVIEREKWQAQRTPPHEGAEEFEGKFWTGSLVIIDPADHLDGQRVAFHDNTDVGQPKAILSSLVAELNSDTAHQYTVLFKALFKGESFWRFAEKHGGRLEYVTFRFSVPNMLLGAGGGVKKGLRRIGKDTEATEVEMKLGSDEGVKADSQSVKEGIAYGEEGNARVTAKALSGEYWSSTKRKLTVKMHSILNFAEAKSGEVQKWLRQALDREPVSGVSRPRGTDSGADSD